MVLDPLLLRTVDLAVLAVLVLGCGVAWRWRRPVSLLLGAAALAWVLADHWVGALFWHRALLVHLLLAYPGWSPPRRISRAVVAGAYGVCVLVPALLLDDRSNLCFGVALVAAASWNFRGSVGRVRHQRRTALAAATLYGGSMVLGGSVGAATSVAAQGPMLVVYDASMVVAVAVLVAALRSPSADQVAGLVVELGHSPADALRDAIAAATRDPAVRVGYWDAAARDFIDVDGSRVDVRADGDRTPVVVDHVDDPVAVVVLDTVLAHDPAVVDAVKAAVRVVAVNARRTAEVLARVHDLEDSRRRLVEASDHERAMLDRELRAGVMADIVALAAEVRTAGARLSSRHLERSAAHLERTASDLADAAAGLRPRDLEGGLMSALGRLATDSPLPVRINGEPGVLPCQVELATWYVCSEALSNAVKHARATSVELRLERDHGTIRVSVCDDGTGGADIGAAGGLAGLRDRVTTVGGRLTVRSGAAGTRLVAELPLGDQQA